MARGIYTDVNLDAIGTTPPSNVRPPSDTEAPEKGASALMGSEFAGKGYLLEEQDDKKVFKAIDEEVIAQEPLAKNRLAASKHRGRIRRGVPFSTLSKDEDRGVWTAELPPGVSDTPSPIPNKADDLCRKIVSQVIVDLPQPDPKPATDDEKDRGAADLAKRFLKVDGDESGTNDPELFRDVLDSSQTDASSFTHLWVDEQGAGWRPLKIQAHPQATDASNPLKAFQPALDPATGQPAIDPMTGEPQMQELPPPAEFTMRHVKDGQFVESAAEASQQWVPRVMRDVLGPQHVRTIPEMADVANAEGVVLLMVGPISDLKRRVPEMKQWTDEQLARLVEWKPKREKVLLPQALRARWKDQQAKKDSLKVDDNTLVFWYQKYCSVGPEYGDGAELIVSGCDGGLVLKRATLRNDIDADGETVVLLRDIPVAQCKALHDSESRDPFGKAPIDLFGATNEGLANLYGAIQQDTSNRLNPNIFLPSTSPVQDWQVRERGGAPIKVYSKDDLPMYEEFADLAAFTPQVIEMLESSMRETAGLGSTAQVLDSDNAKSGVAKQVEVSQAKVFLAPVSQNFFGFAKRYWRLKLELAQAYLTIPQEVEYVGLDQAYKARWFTGADFSGVKDVAIMAGTGTLMSPAEKQSFLQIAQGNGWIDVDEGAEVGRSSVSDDLGLQSSPAEDAIKREIAEWMKGPPEGFTPAQPQMEPMSGQPVVDPNTGQPAMTPPSSTPFQVRPTDEDPMVAKKQYTILRDFCYTSDYSQQQDPNWKALFDQRIQLAMYSAGIQTMRQQAEAAQQQQQAQAQEKDTDRAFKKSEGDANRAAKAQQPGAIAA